MATSEMASNELNDIAHVDFDEELTENSGNSNTEINFEVNNSMSESPSQIIGDMLKQRQPYLILWEKLKHQKDNKYNSRCLSLTFAPNLPNKTETLENKFQEIVKKHRENMITELLETINLEVTELSAKVTKTYKDEVQNLQSNKETEKLTKFVSSVKETKLQLDNERIETKMQMNSALNSRSAAHNSNRGRGYSRPRAMRRGGIGRGGQRYKPYAYNFY